MSEENVEMVRRAFDAYRRGDVDAAVADLAPECEFVSSGALPGNRNVYHGPEGFKARVVHGQAFTGETEALEAAGLEE